MKYCYLFILPLIAFCSYSQDVTVGRSKAGAFIEFFDKNNYAPSSYWITNNSVISLQNAMAKSIEWAKLNSTKQMSFEKEIFRFRSMDKEEYNFYRKFIGEFSKEAIVVFTGFSDGSFKIRIEFDGGAIEFDNVETIKNFIQILKGKSGNRKIDEIFH